MERSDLVLGRGRTRADAQTRRQPSNARRLRHARKRFRAQEHSIMSTRAKHSPSHAVAKEASCALELIVHLLRIEACVLSAHNCEEGRSGRTIWSN
eukprot:6181822-Pleurochrysis_carterae.AAC.1